FLVLLERLGPEERAAFLLREVFDCDYGTLASTLGRSEASCRQMVHRARERLRSDRKRFEVSHAAKTRLLKQFMAAMEAQDEQALRALFAPDAAWTADGGGRVPAAPYPILGADRIAQLLVGLQERFFRNRTTLHLVVVNGEP